MPLHPQVKAYLERQAASGAPPRSAMSVSQTREFMRGMPALAGEAVPLARVEDIRLPIEGRELPVRLYSSEMEGLRPVLVYLHGGRFFSGDLDSHDRVCRLLARESGCLVVAVDYRLAPENKFPAALEDAYGVVAWLAEHGPEIGADPARLSIGGDSAGGNLAAAACLLARERSGPPIVCQVLIYPMLDATCSLPSHIECGSGYGPGSEDMKRGYREYLPENANWCDPLVSPLWAANLAGLPPAFVLSAEYDSLRDEAEHYAHRLQLAGVPVISRRYSGAIHGFFTMAGVFEQGVEAIRETAGYLREMLPGHTVPTAPGS